jgi:AbiV family abortive infection protein
VAVTAEFLLKGYALALEQCGLLLRDAVLLYENKSYANAVVLAAFAREELGRSKILRDFWRQQLGGSPVTIEEINEACNDHVEKQKAGMLSITTRANRDTVLGKILADHITNSPQSQKFKDAAAALKQIDKKTVKHTPDERHAKRKASLYVEPESSNDWNRPADVSAMDAYNCLVGAVNDYSLRYSQGYISSEQSLLKDSDPELYDALQQMTDRPVLPSPVHPSWPTGA